MAQALPQDPPSGVDKLVNEVRSPSQDVENQQGASGQQEDYDAETVEKVYRKLDLRIIPAFWILYFVCSGLRSNIGMAQTMNAENGHDLMTVLNLTPRDTSTALALFYVAYVIFDFPSNLIMSRVSPRAWMARIVMATGIIGACSTAAQAAWSIQLLRFLLGVVIAGMWPGMAYYLTLFYPPSRTGKRIGMYFTAAQVSAAVVGLVSAGFQLMDGLGGLVGFRWMFLLYGLVAIVLGISLLWWLPDRPLPPGQTRVRTGPFKWLPVSPEALTGHDAVVHYHDLRRVYNPRPWSVRDVLQVLMDWRLWPLVLMYFGVVGVGIGTQLYGSVIIRSIVPEASSIEISLLFAPIWIIAGLLTVTFALSNGWARYGGLLMVGFGLGPTVPNCMAWTSEIFQRRHGEVGVAAASALVSGLGNLGSVVTTYALYTGWPEDSAPGRYQFRRSNFAMIGILGMSIASSFVMVVLLKVFGNQRSPKFAATSESGSDCEDGAARRERQQRGLGGLLPGSKPSHVA
ncbi:vitamin H transporter 1/biotin symporter vht1 [Sodiomyces alkalinus F11]|uniref:Vitamin H transporter 1/biotin symporter vht1 n=1 Tax=Sodiomyces alkalinus (strain CBS 110278 / VKM F-3762 / F11) TaxID=1314773 RepID=A0A3N2Q4L0_SODAK|nr:vitamin H transporter 1/biotin symporter vht1 [Sodiomyces alkalinus F11]ROT41545.1 vitamin H transporter 1/biotin symporter vht1 [Sodiomyces alkalinus F11]